MNMIYPVLFILLFSQSAWSQKKGFESRWHDESIYQVNILDYEEQDDVFYLISNNGQYLYVNLLVPSPDEQKKILLFGLTIWVDPGGKSKKDLAIMYPYRRTERRFQPRTLPGDQAGMQRDPFQENQGQGSGTINPRMAITNFDGVKYDLVDRYRLIGLKGYADTADVITIPSTNPFEIHGWMAFDSLGVLVYTIAIPFNKVALKKGESGFSLGIESGCFNQEAMMARRGQGRPGGPGGTGMYEGGSRQSAPDGPGGTGMYEGGSRQSAPDRPGGTGIYEGTGTGSGPGVRSRPSPEQRQAMMQQMEALSTPFRFWIKGITLAEQK